MTELEYLAVHLKSFLNSCLFDEIRVLLTPHPPHKKSRKQASYKHRFNMLEIAFKGFENVSASDLETRLPHPSYTLQTINYLEQNEPENQFFLCLGEDSVETFAKWYHFREILRKISLVVAERPGFDKRKVGANILEKSIFVEHHPVHISSTSIRNNEISERKNMVPASVLFYIRKHKLYE